MYIFIFEFEICKEKERLVAAMLGFHKERRGEKIQATRKVAQMGKIGLTCKTKLLETNRSRLGTIRVVIH
jgi:hypothetical protein